MFNRKLNASLLSYVVVFFLGFLGYALLVKRKKTPPPTLDKHRISIEKIHELGEFTLLELHLRDVFDRKYEYAIPFTETKILLIAEGEAQICMDFAQIRVEKNSDTLWNLYLPMPKVCHFKLDHQKTRIYDATFSMIETFRQQHSQLIEDMYRHAEKKLEEAALSASYQELAYSQAEKILRSFLGSFEVQVRFYRSKEKLPALRKRKEGPSPDKSSPSKI